MTAILNLTQHLSTPDQRAAGVIDLPERERAYLVSLLTFEMLPSREEIEACSTDIATLASTLASPEDREDGTDGFALHAMIGGAPWLMSELEKALLDVGIEPVYAFSRRESLDVTQDDGAVVTTHRFRHIGFVPAR